jgi:hypothetical membrane protein
MQKDNYALTGILGPLTAIIFITAAIVLSPWFSWGNNALSDLGNSVGSDTASIFNFGLLLTGFLTIIYATTSFKKHARITSYALTLAGFSLQLVGAFDEVYGMLHTQISVLFFATLAIASISYMIEKRSLLAASALIIGLASWILYGLEIYSSGIAVPEAISSMATATWVVISALRIYLNKQSDSNNNKNWTW